MSSAPRPNPRSIRLSRELNDALVELSERQKVSVNALIVRAIKKLIEEDDNERARSA